MPDLSDEEYAALKTDIAENGVKLPIVIDEETGYVIDGHHRLRAVRELVKVGKYPFGPPEMVLRAYADDTERFNDAYALNLQRRNLSREQKQAVIDAVLRRSPKYSDRRLGELLGVSKNTVKARRDLLTSTGQVDQLDKTVGKDGRVRTTKPKAPRPKPVVEDKDNLEYFVENLRGALEVQNFVTTRDVLPALTAGMDGNELTSLSAELSLIIRKLQELTQQVGAKAIAGRLG